MTGAFGDYAAVLLDYDAAAQRAWEAAIGTDANEATDAERELMLKRDDVEAFEMSQANEWLMGMRLALKYYPSNVVAFLDDAKELVEEWESANRRLWMAESRR